MRKLAVLILLILTAGSIGGQAVFAQFAGLPDLTVAVSAPTSAFPGQDITSGLVVKVSNIGTATATGNLTTPCKGYITDLVLSSDKFVPQKFASYSANYSEDVLLKGGRDGNTKDLPISTTIKANLLATIPSDTPPGDYFVCALVDPPNFISELDEKNNVGCSPITISAQANQTTSPLLIDGPNSVAYKLFSVIATGNIQAQVTWSGTSTMLTATPRRPPPPGPSLTLQPPTLRSPTHHL